VRICSREGVSADAIYRLEISMGHIKLVKVQERRVDWVRVRVRVRW
tara:strand:- start:159 stop:296 length:138 start_codon:yes stop_codon:yes gene_type:complete